MPKTTHPEHRHADLPNQARIYNPLTYKGKTTRLDYLPRCITIHNTPAHLVARHSIPHSQSQLMVLSGIFRGIGYRNILPSIERITEIARLEPDWDSYKAAPPAESAVDGAYELILLLNRLYGPSLKASIQPHHIAPLGDGGMQLEWKGPQSELEVQISPSGTFGYLLTRTRGTERSFDEADEVPLPKIIQLIVDVVRHN